MWSIAAAAALAVVLVYEYDDLRVLRCTTTDEYVQYVFLQGRRQQSSGDIQERLSRQSRQRLRGVALALGLVAAAAVARLAWIVAIRRVALSDILPEQVGAVVLLAEAAIFVSIHAAKAKVLQTRLAGHATVTRK